ALLAMQRGGTILEVEPAIWSLVGGSEGDDSRRPLAHDEILDLHARECWKDIAARWREQRLLIATSRRLLDWLWLRTHLVMKTKRAPDKWIVSIAGVKDPGGTIVPLSAENLNGLSLTLPEKAPEGGVTIDNMSATPAFQRAPDNAVPGRHAGYLPWSPLAWPGA